MGKELALLLRLGLPVSLGQLGLMLLNVVDTAMLGHLGVEQMAAASLATQWIFVTLTMGLGLVMGIDPIVAQRHGAADGRGAAHALQHGILLALASSVVVSVCWLGTGPLFVALGQDPELSRLAHRYVLLQLPSVFPFLGWCALRSYLQGREIVAPAMWVMLPVNLLNLFFNWLFIFGPGPWPAWGLEGAAVATCVSRVLMGVFLLAWVIHRNLHQGAWETPKWRQRMRWSELKVPVALGVPSSLQMGLEVSAFGVTALMAGTLDREALAAHSIALSCAGLLFMIPLGVSFGTTTRVGNLIGAQRVENLPRTLMAVAVCTLVVMGINVTCLVGGGRWIASFYTNDAIVQRLATATLVVVAAFQVADCAQVVAAGALRGMGRTRAPALFVLVGYYGFGLPLGYYLGIDRSWGLHGLWWGLATGLFVLSIGVLAWLVFVMRTRRIVLVPSA